MSEEKKEEQKIEIVDETQSGVVEKPVKEEQLKTIKEQIKTETDLNEIEDFLSKNSVEFEHDEVVYKINKPTYKQKNEAYQKKVERFTELLNDDKYKLEDDLKRTYKRKGVDIDAMITQKKQLETKKNNYMLKIGALLKAKSDEKDLLVYREEIAKINEDMLSLTMKVNSLLEFSLENQVLISIYAYLTYIVTEKKEGDNWVKAWNSFDDFQNCSSDLVIAVSARAALLIGQI